MPELFQSWMNKILEGLSGFLWHIDDVLVYAATDRRLQAVMERLKTEGVSLNKQKCEFYKSEIKFLGLIISGSGICQGSHDDCIHRR